MLPCGSGMGRNRKTLDIAPARWSMHQDSLKEESCANAGLDEPCRCCGSSKPGRGGSSAVKRTVDDAHISVYGTS